MDKLIILGGIFVIIGILNLIVFSKINEMCNGQSRQIEDLLIRNDELRKQLDSCKNNKRIKGD